MRNILFIVLALVIVGGGAYILGKGGLNVSFGKATPSTTLGTSSPAPAALTTSPTSEPSVVPSASPVADENNILIASVKAGLIAEHGQNASVMVVTVSKIEGDFAKGMANEQGGGGIWFAAKVGGTWKLVWDGNGIIMCSDLTNYPNFPADLIPSCWDTATNKLINR